MASWPLAFTAFGFRGLCRSENQPANGEAESRHNGERLIHQLPVLSVLVISVDVSSTSMKFLADSGIQKVRGWGVAYLLCLCLDKMWPDSLEVFHHTPYKALIMVIA